MMKPMSDIFFPGFDGEIPSVLKLGGKAVKKTGGKGLFVGRPVEEATVKILKSVSGAVEIKKMKQLKRILQKPGNPEK